MGTTQRTELLETTNHGLDLPRALQVLMALNKDHHSKAQPTIPRALA
jgi:hypothetical protein